MPTRSIHSVLSSHNLFSEYRGPRILNEEGIPPPAPTPSPAPTPEPKPNPEPAPAPNPKPKPDDTEGRITELTRKNKELQEQIDSVNKAKKDEEDEKLKKRGEHEKIIAERDTTSTTLTQERDSASAKLAKYEADAQKRIEDSLASITDAEKAGWHCLML